MKLNPEIKQLNKEKRKLERIINTQQERINQLELHCKNIRINFYMYFIQYFVSGLTQREKKILSMRFGFEDGIPKTLEETGEEFGVTRDRIRQIQAKATEKIIRLGRKEVVNKLKKYDKNRQNNK